MEKAKKIVIYSIVGYLIGVFILVFIPREHNFNRSGEANFKQICFSSKDRVLVISPHPDDAALATSGVIEKCEEKGGKIKIVYITYGTHNTSTMVKEELVPTISGAIELGEKRHNEALNAMKILGLSKNDLVFLGFPDSGTLKIWTDHFTDKPYFSGVTLHNNVFYNTAYKIKAQFTAEEELKLIEQVIVSFKPTKIFYPSTYDLNPDHRASGLFTEAALFDLQNKIHPEEYTYFVHAQGWPGPRGLYPDLLLSPPAYIKNISSNWCIVRLNNEEEVKKENVVKAHKSQVETKPQFMYSFVRKNELFLVPASEKFDSNLPIWSKKVMEKFGISPFVESVDISEQGQYIKFIVKLYRGIPPFTKLDIFLYPELTSTPFSNTPKYKIMIDRAIDKDLHVSLMNRDKSVLTSSTELRGNVREPIFEIEINKKYLVGSKMFFAAIQIEQAELRVSETPWWNVKIP